MNLWQQGSQWFNHLSLRERALITITLLTFIILPGYVLFIEPALIQQTSLQIKINRLTQSNNEKKQDIQVLKQQPIANDNHSLRDQARQLTAEINTINRVDIANSDRLLNVEQASQLLSTVLNTASNLTLVSLDKVNASPVVMPRTGNDRKARNSKRSKNTAAGLFRHPLELNLSGNTADLMAFITQIEQQQLPITIDSVTWRYGKGQRAELSLNFYSLGVSKNWLGGGS